jgi:hypothetical protein
MKVTVAEKVSSTLSACVLVLSGCGATTDSHAETSTPATTSTASASPPGFPDLSQLSPADTATFWSSHPYFSGVQFRTPDGQDCYSNDMNSLDKPAVRTLSCEGPRPDRGPGTWTIDVASDRPASIEPADPPLNPTYTPDPSTASPLLPPSHTIEYKGVVCGVEQATAACRVGDHGFVLTPTATTLF